MAPPCNWPGESSVAEAIAAAPLELLPTATPSNPYPNASPSGAPSKSLTGGDLTPQPTTPWLSIQMPHPHPVDAPTLPIPRRGRERCALPVEYRLARLSALAARTSTASSSRASTSPRWCRHRRHGSCSPSPRFVQEGALNTQGSGF